MAASTNFKEQAVNDIHTKVSAKLGQKISVLVIDDRKDVNAYVIFSPNSLIITYEGINISFFPDGP